MVRRPNRDDVLRLIPGYKFEYGYDSTVNPTGLPTSTRVEDCANSRNMPEALGSEALGEFAERAINGDAFDPPNVNGKVPYSEALFDVISWFELDYVKHRLKSQLTKLKPHFREVVLPATVNTLYLTFYFAFKKNRHPLTKNCIFSISLPVKGSQPGHWKLIFVGGRIDDGL